MVNLQEKPECAVQKSLFSGGRKAGQLHVLAHEIRTLHIQKENSLKTKIKDDIVRLQGNGQHILS